MNVANLSELVNAQWVVGSTSWELESYAAANVAPKAGCAAFIRNEAELDAAIKAGALAIVCESKFAKAAEDAQVAAVVVLDVAQALARLVRLLCAHKNFYEAGALECDIAYTQGYSVLEEDIFGDFAVLMGPAKMHLCKNSDYLAKICAPLVLPPADFIAMRAGSFFYEDVEICGRFYSNAPLCFLFNESYSRVYAAALASGCARALKQVFSAVFLAPDGSVAKFGSTQRAVIFTHSERIAQILRAHGISQAIDFSDAMKKSVSYSLADKSDFLPQITPQKFEETSLF